MLIVRTYIRLVLFLLSIGYSPALFSQEQLPTFDEMIILAPLPLTHEVHEIKTNSSVHESLINAGVPPQTIHEIVKTSRPDFNLRHIQPGTRYILAKNPDKSIRRISFEISPLTRLEVNYSHQEWSSEITDVDTTKQILHYSGTIKDSLWGSGIEQKLSPEVIVSFAEVFGWQIDFSREVQKGDRWKFSVEKLFADGRAVGWGNILYAEYQNSQKNHKAYFYKNKATNTQGYFDENGSSLRKVFLKSPIKFGKITSRFSRRRFHPIHKRFKAHNGVDYGAPRGTPIRAVGDGRVVKIGRFPGSGNMIVLDHIAGYQTKYLHLNRFKKGLRRGSQVLQGQLIGYVGSTGFATGPHLHFEMSRHRKIMNPLKVNLPSSDPVPDEALAHFKSHITTVNREIASTYETDKEVPCCESNDLKSKKSQLQ